MSNVIKLSELPPLSREQQSVATAVSNETTVLSSDPRVVEFFGGSAAASGMAVTATTAQRVATVYACMARIAGGISTMPLRIYERVWDGSVGLYQRKPVDDADLFWLLNEQPTAAFTAASGWELTIQSVLLRGDGFKWMRRKRSGKIDEIVPLDWGAVTPRRQPNHGRLIYAVNDGYNATGVDQDDMLHLSGLGFNGERAPSVIQYAARQAIGNALAMDEYSGKVFQGGAHHSMVLETEKAIKDPVLDTMRRQFAERYSGMDNAHRMPLILTEGLTAKPVTMSAEDAQLLESKRFQVIDICRAFGVPPHMVGETSASTTWGSGLEAMGRAFVTYTLNPHLRRFEQELNRKLFRTVRFYVEFDREALMAGDSKAQADADKASLGGPGAGPGWESVNGVRRRRNLPPIDDPKYDVPFWPPDKAAGATSQPPARPGEPDEDPDHPAHRRPGEHP